MNWGFELGTAGGKRAAAGLDTHTRLTYSVILPLSLSKSERDVYPACKTD